MAKALGRLDRVLPCCLVRPNLSQGRRTLSSTRSHRSILSEHEDALGNKSDGVKPSAPEKGVKDSVCLPTVCVPKSLQLAQDNLLSGYPYTQLVSDGAAVMKYLQTRRPPSVQDLKIRKKGLLKTTPTNIWKEDTPSHTVTIIQAPLRYGRREGMACVASRPQAGYGVCLRVLNEPHPQALEALRRKAGAEKSGGGCRPCFSPPPPFSSVLREPGDEVAKLQPNFSPQVMLDFGSGLGTALWAAHEVWGQSLYQYQAIDSSQEMGELARALRTGGQLTNPSAEVNVTPTTDEVIAGVYFKQYLPVSNKVQYDLVVAANALSELSTVGIRRSTIASLWRKTGDILVLIEFGNKAGYNVINEARDLILSAGSKWSVPVDANEKEEKINQLYGHILAPCPHDNPCPLSVSQEHCSFAQRVQLSPSQRHTALRHQGYHIEPFSYLVIKKGLRPETNESPSHVRLLKPVKKRNRHVVCNLCCPNGKAKQLTLTKTKSDKELYRRARKSNWGDTIAVPTEMYAASASTHDNMLKDEQQINDKDNEI